MTSKLTREQLHERARENVKALKMASRQTAFESAREEILADLQLAELVLAAMDGEPVAWTWHYREQWHVTNDKCRAEFVATDGDVAVLPLYRHAQPAPEKYNIGDATMRHIFTPTGMTNVSDMQAVFDRVEAVLVGMDQPAPVVPDDVLDALQKVARIRLDLNDFDGDRRGIADCLGDAEEALIEVVNRRAAMLNGGKS